LSDASEGLGGSIARALAGADIRLGIQVGVAALAFLIFVGVIYPAPAPILFLGAVLGSLSALVAMGLVLVYRANRIVNFAQGDLGGLAAVLASSLMVGSKWGFWAASAVGLLAALVLGAGTEFLVIRRFARAPRLILTVATIGLLELFAAGQLALPKLFNFTLVPQPPVPFHFRWTWFPVTFNAGHLLILIVVPIVTIGLIAFFRYTDVGIAVRAQAESADRASLLGIPVKRLGTLVWVIAAGMSGLGVLLRLPIQGVAIGSVLGPSLLLRALAAAVIGRMESLTVTFAAAIGLGVIEQSVFFVSGNTIVVDAVMFFVIIGALLFQRRQRQSRAEESGISTWAAVREVRPIPRELAAVPLVRRTVIALSAAVAAFLIFVPLRMSSGTVSLFGVGLIFAMVVVSLVVLTGWAGQISLGHLAFVAWGAAVAGTLAQHGSEFFVTLIAAALTGAVVALVVGVPALRIRGLFLAVTTLAFAVTTGTYFLNETYFAWLVPKPEVRIVRPVLFGKFDLDSSEYAYYYFVLIVAIVVIASVWSLRNSRTGRAMVAVRDNTRAAQSFGINRIRSELTAFALAGFIAALAGGILAYHQGRIPSNVLQTPPNFRIFSVAVIGGLGSIPGALLGAAYQTILEFSPLTRVPSTQLFASGAGLLFFLLVFPAGLGGLLYDIRDALLRTVARRKGIVVPSLLADVRELEEGAAEAPQPKREPARKRADSLLRVENLDVAYGKAQVLFGVDFDVAPGEIVALLGTNGAGKSTLLGAIAGLVAPIGGSVTFDGRDVTTAGPNQTVSAGIVLMPGSRGVFPTLTVEENLRLAAWLYRKDADYVRSATDQVMSYFPVLRERRRQKGGNLSGGEQQMLTLSQVFIAKPRVLMIDELSLGLAPLIVQRLLDIVRAINESGTAVVLVEQSVNIAITLAERAAFLEKGEVRFEGRTADLLDRPDLARSVFLGRAAKAAGGRGVGRRVPAAKLLESPVALATTELSVSFGGIHAVEDVSIDARMGQILGIIGPNGAGKTTVFDSISGFVQPTSGVIALDGTDVTEMGPDGRAALGLGRSFQDARLFPSMTVRQAIATALDRHVQVRDPIAAFVISPAVRMSERSVREDVDRLIELLHLNAFADKFVGELSTGTRRIVDIACALAHDPKVLLLDEPSSGLAQRETEALAPVLVDIRDRTGAALLVIEHDIPLVTSISDELVALELGRVVVRGRPRDVINHPDVIEGYLGSSEAAIRRSGKGRGPSKRAPRRKAAAARAKKKTTTRRPAKGAR
jgi:ABC-type branched-subunit amino acid transport system ATPase component/branched-subunit amino acid ABC-type transport system permease component